MARLPPIVDSGRTAAIAQHECATPETLLPVSPCSPVAKSVPASRSESTTSSSAASARASPRTVLHPNSSTAALRSSSGPRDTSWGGSRPDSAPIAYSRLRLVSAAEAKLARSVAQVFRGRTSSLCLSRWSSRACSPALSRAQSDQCKEASHATRPHGLAILGESVSAVPTTPIPRLPFPSVPPASLATSRSVSSSALIASGSTLGKASPNSCNRKR